MVIFIIASYFCIVLLVCVFVLIAFDVSISVATTDVCVACNVVK